MAPRRLLRLLPALLALAGPGAALPASPQPQPQAQPQAQALDALAESLRLLTENPIVRSGTVGFFLAPLTHSHLPLLQQNPHQSFIPASALKTLTTGSALALLGPDFTFDTHLFYLPDSGDLLVQGAGDPSLGRPHWNALFDHWTLALRAAHISEITGRILADESAWEDQELPPDWTWIDIGNYYAPPLTPLSFHDNAFRLHFHLQGNPGDPAAFYDADPWPANLDITDRIRIGTPGSGDQALAVGAPGSRRLILRGSLAPDAGKSSIRAALPDPALFCVQQLTDWLNARQIPVHGTPATTRSLPAPDAADAPKRLLIATHHSPPLRDLLFPIHQRSLNLDCECLLRTLGQGQAHRGLLRIRQLLADCGLPLPGYQQTDGSGLSRTNMITPALLARANAAFLTSPTAALFQDSLPLLLSDPAPIRAKNGSIHRVRTFTGLVSPAASPPACFALLINNYDGPTADLAPLLDAFFEALANL